MKGKIINQTTTTKSKTKQKKPQPTEKTKPNLPPLPNCVLNYSIFNPVREDNENRLLEVNATHKAGHKDWSEETCKIRLNWAKENLDGI